MMTLYSTLQRMRIIRRDRGLLVLRELPLIEWSSAVLLLIVAVNFTFFSLMVTALAAIIVAVALVVTARTRTITFSVETSRMSVESGPFVTTLVSEMPLVEIQRAELAVDSDGFSQIMLRTYDDLYGFSIHSKDSQPWKPEIVLAINQLLDHFRGEDVD